MKLFTKHIKKISGIIIAIIISLFVSGSKVQAINSSQGLSSSQLDIFSRNSIFFYDPGDCITSGGGFSTICGSTVTEKYISALGQYYDMVHVAGILGNIANEGGFNPVMWQGNAVGAGGVWKNHDFDYYYNSCSNSCSVGVGAFQITTNLSGYLHYVNDTAPDLLKYYQNPQEYGFSYYYHPSGSYDTYGDILLEKIGDVEFDRLLNLEVYYFIENFVKPRSAGFDAATTPSEAGRAWAHDIERCAACGYNGGDSELYERAAASEAFYEEWSDFTCSGGTTISSVSSSNNTSSSNDSSASSVTWQDGWITSGISGYTKEPAEGSSYVLGDDAHTGQFINNKPNKILLHSTEGGPGSGNSGLAIYSNNGGIFPAHFTINLKDKKLYQHYSIYHPADAIKSHDNAAGIQIEIIGFSRSNTDSPWYLLNEANFSNNNWAYLGKLLNAISEETGISLTSSVDWENPSRLSYEDFKSYEGILGHMHATDNDHNDPNNIWPMVQKAIGSDNCTTYEGEYPEYLQSAEPWGSMPYGPGCNYANCSCGASSLAMLATYLTGQDIFPNDVGDILGSSVYWQTTGVGAAALDKRVGEVYGFEAEGVTYSSLAEAEQKMRQYLDDGYVLHFSGAGSYPYSSGGHYIGIFGWTGNGDNVMVANSAFNGNAEMSLHDVVYAGAHGRGFSAIKSNNNISHRSCNNANYCSSRSQDNPSTGNNNILRSVEEIIELANQNGSTYGYGQNRSISAFDAMLNGAPVNTDCTGFASLVIYKTYGTTSIFSSSSIFSNSHYEEVPRSEVQPGDIFAYTSPQGHGGIVIEASNGIVTKIAETGGTEGRSGNNNNIGYSGPESFSVTNMNGPNGHFFRWKGN